MIPILYALDGLGLARLSETRIGWIEQITHTGRFTGKYPDTRSATQPRWCRENTTTRRTHVETPTDG